MKKTLIKLENVWKVYKMGNVEVNALQGLSLDVKEGEFLAIMGPSGSGKSSFLQLMIREENVTSGDIHFNDFHVNELKGREVNKLRQSIGYVFQDFRLLATKGCTARKLPTSLFRRE